MTQGERIIAYVKEFGSISSLEAFKDLGITRLSARIFDLEDKGIRFDRKTEEVENRYGEKVRYTRYSLMGKEQNNDGQGLHQDAQGA